MQLSTTYKEGFKQAISLSLPIIAGQLGMILMGFFDTIQIGVLGADYIAAAGISNSVYWLMTLLGMGVLFSISPLVSEAFGEQHGWKAIGVYRSGLKVAAGLSVVSTLLTFIGILNFNLLGQTEHISGISTRYLFIVNFGTPVMFFFSVGKQLLDGMGRTKLGMYISLVGLGVNVLLNWLLIQGQWGFPALGIEGAAIATTCARVLMTLIVFLIIRYDSEVKALVNTYHKTGVTKSYVSQIFTIGFPYALQMFWEIGAFGAAQIMSGWISEKALAAHQITINLASVTFMAVTGISAAGTIMTGYAYGARNLKAIAISANTVLGLTLAIELCFAAMFFVARKFFPTLYTADAEVIGIAASLLVFAALFQISDGLQSVASGVARGIQDTKMPSLLAFISYWLIMVPLCYYLGFHTHLGIEGIWLGTIVGLTIASILLILRFKMKLKNLEFSEL